MDDSRIRDWFGGGYNSANRGIFFRNQSAHGADAARILRYGVLVRFYGASDCGGGLSPRNGACKAELITSYLAGMRTSQDAAPMQSATAAENITWTGP